MSVAADLRFVSEHLVDTQALRRAGASERDVRRALHTGALTRLRPGWYARAPFWSVARPEVRHLAAILAAHRTANSPPVFSHLSAAAIHGWPAWSTWLHPSGTASPEPDPRTAHATVAPRQRASSSDSLVRHRSRLDEADIASLAPFRCTGPERTVTDLARTQPFEVALSSADAHLRTIARVGRQVDHSALRAWRDDAHDRADRLRTRAGSRAARAIATLADPLADSPLESVSRFRFQQLGIDVTLQVPVAARGRGSHYLDFVLDGLGFWGEADGRSKYLEPGLRGGRSAEEVVYEEKRRSDWIAGSTGLRVIRWGVAEVSSLRRFASHLQAHGVTLPAGPSIRWGHTVREFLRELP